MSLAPEQRSMGNVSHFTSFTDGTKVFTILKTDLRYVFVKRCQAYIKPWHDLTLEDHCSVDCGALHIVFRKRWPQECVIVPRCAPTDLLDIVGESIQPGALTTSVWDNNNGGLTGSIESTLPPPKYLKLVNYRNRGVFNLWENEARLCLIPLFV